MYVVVELTDVEPTIELYLRLAYGSINKLVIQINLQLTTQTCPQEIQLKDFILQIRKKQKENSIGSSLYDSGSISIVVIPWWFF